ncbi:MAG: hypothetical protein ACRDVW_07825 [Acidimicrobiales bacterium]
MARFRAEPADDDPARGRAERDLDDLRSLCAQIVGDATEPMGVYAFRPEEPGAALALHVEERVFEEAIGDTAAAVVADEFAPYDHATLLFCVVDQHRKLPAAMLRLILPSKTGLKSMHDIEPIWGISAQDLFAGSDLDYDPDHTWDLATLAIGPEYRAAAFQGMVTMSLCQSVSMLGARLGFPWSIALLHVPVLRMLQWKLQRPFNEFNDMEPRPYLDSPASLPAWMHLPEWHRRLADRDRVLYTMMTEGNGLEPAVRPPDWDKAAELAAEVSALADLRLHLR